MSNPVPGADSTQAARSGSAINASDLDITIRTVAAVLWASERSSARVSAHWWAPAAARICSGMCGSAPDTQDRKSTRLNSSHPSISYAVFCLKKKNFYVVNYVTNKYD